jgi:hypothetical protein
LINTGVEIEGNTGPGVKIGVDEDSTAVLVVSKLRGTQVEEGHPLHLWLKLRGAGPWSRQNWGERRW